MKNRIIKATKINYEEEDSILDFLNEYEYISFDGITYMIWYYKKYKNWGIWTALGYIINDTFLQMSIK